MFTFLLKLFISVLILSVSFCHAESKPLSTKIPVIQVHAEKLSPLDIGLEIGRQSKLIFSDIEQRYDAYLLASLSQMRFDDILKNRLPELKRYVDSSYQKELEGVASAWSLVHKNKLGDGFLSWDEYLLLNLLPDLVLPANGTGFGVLDQVSKEDSTIIGRNFDFTSTAELRGLQTITVYDYKSRAVVNIGFAGIISVVTGFNESGLFVAHFNAAPDSSYQNPFKVKQNVKQGTQAHVFALRKALEVFNSASQAINYFSKQTYGVSSNTLVADKKSIQVLEYSSSGKVEVRRWDSKVRANMRWGRKLQIAVVDCHALSDMTNNCRRAKDGYRWNHLRALASFTSEKKSSVQDISKIMLNNKNQYYEILGDDTIQSMIYLPDSGHLYLYAAPISATEMPPSYQVYYQDLMPESIRNPPRKRYFFWWVIGFLMFLAFVLWRVRISMKAEEEEIPKAEL